MTLAFDLDGTLCTDTNGDYDKCLPMEGRVGVVQWLYRDGHTIVIHTARSKARRGITRRQLLQWHIPYHHLVMNKPKAHLYIDDKGDNSDDFFRNIAGS